MPKYVATSVSLPAAMFEEIKERAWLERSNVSEWVRNLITDYLERPAFEDSPPIVSPNYTITGAPGSQDVEALRRMLADHDIELRGKDEA